MSSPSPNAPWRTRATALSYAIVVVAVAASFRSAPFLGFVDYDDPAIVLNPVLREGFSWESLAFAFTESPLNLWHPLTFLSHILDFELYGDWAGGHHLTNLLLHLASSLLLLAWLRRETGAAGLALAATLLFAVHPLRVESVVWVAERKDVLSFFFFLLTLWFYSSWTRASPEKRRRHYLLAVAAATLGVLSKPSLMTLPAALLLVDFWPLRRLTWADRNHPALLKARLVEKIPFLGLALAAAAIAWATWSGNQFIGEPPNFGFAQRVGFAAFAYLSYLHRTLVPLELVPFLPYPPGLPASILIGAVALVLAITALVLWRHRQSPWLLFGWLWFLGMILPGSGIITISDHFAPDRYTYLAHVGLFVALVWEVAAWTGKWRLPPSAGRVLGGAALALVVVPLVIFTNRQSRVWSDAETLWRHTLSHTERNYVAHNQLALALLQSDRYDEGVAELEAAMAANPGFPIPLGNLSLARAKKGDLEEAVRLLREAGPHLPERKRFQNELLAASLASGKNETAATLWRDIAADHPENAAIQLEAAEFLYGIGEEEEALGLYLAASRLQPDNARATLNLGALLVKRGMAEQALPWLERSAATATDPPSVAEARRTLAQAHLMRRDWAKAIAEYERALTLTPDRALLVNELAQLLLDCPDATLRDPAKALALAENLPTEAEPGVAVANPRYLRTLARALSRNGDETRAKEAAAKGLDSVETLAGQAPLAPPWTSEELENLRRTFLEIAEAD